MYQHGFPEDTPPWLLTEDKIDLVPKEQQPIEKQPYTCIKCGTVYKPTKIILSVLTVHSYQQKDTELLIKQGRLVELKKKSLSIALQTNRSFMHN